MHTLTFIAAGKNASLLSKPGTGKAHIAKPIALEAVTFANIIVSGGWSCRPSDVAVSSN
ncbi:hypothetical protein IVB44_00130 [Bradyrhizobium sp. 49]|nr:hypothetical protein [Bradyrhizobium sp. 84]MCK1369482.1 hypothetical protein [Bradyrhizobium sp. 49]